MDKVLSEFGVQQADANQNTEKTGVQQADAEKGTSSIRRDGDVDDPEEASCQAEVILVQEQNSMC